jgi:hypothetical protein
MFTRIIFALVSFTLTGIAMAAQLGVTLAVASGSGSGTPFTALHTYYVSPTGSDSNNGLTAATPWATPNHTGLVCGDVIVAAAGTYTSSFRSWGAVSNCPSTTGGIDGKGGIYFATLLCGGSDITSCASTTGLSGTAYDVNASNWAVEGMYVNTGATHRAFEGVDSTGVMHHVAFINDVSVNNLQGADTNDGGSHSPVGVDYFATVGMIAQNSAQDSICLAAIDVVGPGVFDTNAGTHYFVYGNFSYSHDSPSNCQPGGQNSDVEDYMADTWDVHGVTTTGVFSNNIGFNSARMCFNITAQTTTASPKIKFYNNSCYDDNQNTGNDFADGEVGLGVVGTVIANYTITLNNNLAQQSAATNDGNAIYAEVVGGQHWTGLTDSGNFYNGNSTSCGSGVCSSGSSPYSATYFNSNTAGANTFRTPGYTNVTDLMTNRTSAPTCTGFQTTTECMGWNPNTKSLTTPSIISDLVPTASGTSGKGYQLPSTICAANPDYPTWLKGIVYLHWNSGTSTITENGGLVTKPCGM